MPDKDSILNTFPISASENETSVSFFSEVRQIIDEARSNAVRSVDFCRVQMYWNIGRRIFEEEQQGKNNRLTSLNDVSVQLEKMLETMR